MSTWAILGLLAIIVGLILLIVGLVYLGINISKNQNQPWWVWFLIILGSVIMVIGILLAVFGMRVVNPIQPQVGPAYQPGVVEGTFTPQSTYVQPAPVFTYTTPTGGAYPVSY